ncbi:MAG: tRNA (N6-isopentenyl adenosine(37)-C2)-methylthiotransferase MiaB [Candidatus Cloacimonetes bacterium]|nr:tRNA (N6-isopentenyl adenosine(37)-C2)-methylthiotransferase MiaB [Candidatus Cloacimonadota bacterium]
MKKIFIETYGCQMNVADSELVAGIITDTNHQITDDINSADVIIFNTCSVRQHAEDRVLGRIANESSRKKNKPGLKIGVIGCMAQRLGETLLNNKAIDFVVGVDQYSTLPDIIDNLDEHDHYFTEVNNSEIYEGLYPIRQNQLNAFVTIMRGCNNFCSYCIVPYTRGRERSRPLPEIIREISDAGNKGFKDITLLGQNVNSYKWQDYSFPELLKEANSIDSIRRIRFVTSHPKDLSDKLIDTMASSDKVCEHIHLAMQSGDDDVLKRMNRGYSAEHYYNLTEKLRAEMPEIAITTDIIAGFPGETENQFLNTYRYMEMIEFDYAFTFKYSPRTGTKAADFINQIPEEIRLERLQRLIELQEKITLKKYQEQIGKIKEIYVEGISKKSEDEVSGKSRDFKITVFPGDKTLIGSFVKVKITDATGWTLRGERTDIA